MIPRSLISNTALGDKRVIVYSSIVLSNWTGDQIEDLVLYSHFSTCRDKTGTLNQCRQVISELVSLGYYSPTDRGMVYIKPKEGFGVIHKDEFRKVVSERDRRKMLGQRMNHAHVLLLLAHIRANIIKKPGQPEQYSNLLSKISEQTGLSVRSISAAIDILEQLEIIHTVKLRRYQGKDGRWHSNLHVFENATTGNQLLSPLDRRGDTQ